MRRWRTLVLRCFQNSASDRRTPYEEIFNHLGRHCGHRGDRRHCLLLGQHPHDHAAAAGNVDSARYPVRACACDACHARDPGSSRRTGSPGSCRAGHPGTGHAGHSCGSRDASGYDALTIGVSDLGSANKPSRGSPTRTKAIGALFGRRLCIEDGKIRACDPEPSCDRCRPYLPRPQSSPACAWRTPGCSAQRLRCRASRPIGPTPWFDPT